MKIWSVLTYLINKRGTGLLEIVYETAIVCLGPVIEC